MLGGCSFQLSRNPFPLGNYGKTLAFPEKAELNTDRHNSFREQISDSGKKFAGPLNLKPPRSMNTIEFTEKHLFFLHLYM